MIEPETHASQQPPKAMTEPLSRDLYVALVLSLYVELPETPARANAQDREQAQRLFAKGVPGETVEAALLLASLRRLIRPSHAGPLGVIRSLAYFQPVIEEMLQTSLARLPRTPPPQAGRSCKPLGQGAVMTIRLEFRSGVAASASPYRVACEPGGEIEWVKRFLDMQRVRGLTELSPWPGTVRRHGNSGWKNNDYWWCGSTTRGIDLGTGRNPGYGPEEDLQMVGAGRVAGLGRVEGSQPASAPIAEGGARGGGGSDQFTAAIGRSKRLAV